MPLLETSLIAILGGGLFQLLHIPLAWMLGPMTALMIWNGWSKRKLVWPIHARNAGLILLGYTMGLAFTLETGKQIIKQLPSMMAATAATIAFSLLVGYAVSRITKVSLSTGIIGSIPGGLTQMVVLSEEVRGTDVTVVTFMQTIRLLAVIFIVPMLAIHGLADSAPRSVKPVVGAISNSVGHPSLSWHTLIYGAVIALATWAAIRAKFPTPHLMGPMLASAVLMMSGLHAPVLPHIGILIAQLLVGAYMGLSMKPGNMSNWRKLLPYTLASSIVIVLFSLLLGEILSLWYPISLLTGFLGTAPGGMTEMGVTATVVHADLSIVVAYQMFRILFILLAVPPLLGRWLKSAMKLQG